MQKLNRFLTYFLFLVLAITLTQCDNTTETPKEETLLAQLNALPGVTATEITPQNQYYARQFKLDITQLVDHENQNGPTFIQTCYLSHSDEDKAMVMNTCGYTGSARRVSELAGLLDANYLDVPHRYYPGATVTPLEWEYLTIEQAAADHHFVVSTLKEIYDASWINTGGSKSGMSALFHRRHYPDDVDVTVAYVAPLPNDYPDTRFYTFLNAIGDEATRTRIKEVQYEILEDKDNLVPLASAWATANGLHFSIGFEKAIEFAVLEYAVYFWQYGGWSLVDIPEKGASSETLFNHLNSVSSLYYYCDEDMLINHLLYYQSLTEFGYYGFMTDHLTSVLDYVDETGFKLLTPLGNSLTLDKSKMQDIVSWLQSDGDRIIYIYGEKDPWTAAAIELTGAADALKIIQPGENHGVKISDCDEKQQIYDKLEEWLGVEIN